jgi:hypothetical protein
MKVNHSIIKKAYLYCLAFFLDGFALLFGLSVMHNSNYNGYLLAGLFGTASFLCVWLADKKEKKIWKTIVIFLAIFVVVYLIAKIICISRGGPISLY